ncbi:hypothetical protein PIB30_007732 [Stylosanthes scabra]|uniref:Protein kinase domain-containing protein n=1 Tax=Stylosanthes scabra TaxID=79078 RepID=A0ABU6Y371_9FABA|nr:hypothetical protein [Stylosanthes scabra]
MRAKGSRSSIHSLLENGCKFATLTAFSYRRHSITPASPQFIVGWTAMMHIYWSSDLGIRNVWRVIDFGSGIDEFTLKHLYGSTGPSRAEQTYEYTPPEALLNATWCEGPTSSTLKYNMWSVGVVMLELVLGTPNVFQIDALTQTLLDQHLDGWNEGVKELAHK